MSDNRKPTCCHIIIIFITIILGILMITDIAIPLAKYEEYNEYECQVTDVIYPTELPSKENMVGWTSCNCGRSCKKAYTPCIDVYVKINDSPNSYKAFNSFLTNNERCTFYDNRCPDGEDILEVREKLNNAITKAQFYKNKTIPCYTNDNYNPVYLEKDISITLMIIIGVFFLLTLMCSICMCFKKED